MEERLILCFLIFLFLRGYVEVGTQVSSVNFVVESLVRQGGL